jgi:hypothetical protein
MIDPFKKGIPYFIEGLLIIILIEVLRVVAFGGDFLHDYETALMLIIGYSISRLAYHTTWFKKLQDRRKLSKWMFCVTSILCIGLYSTIILLTT